MPEIKLPEISNDALKELARKALESAPAIMLAVLTAGSLLAAARYYPDALVLLVPLFTAASTILIARYQLLKVKMKELRAAVDAMDNALADDTLTVDELRDVFQKVRVLVLR